MSGGVELLDIRPEQLSSADLGDQQVLYDPEELKMLEKDASLQIDSKTSQAIDH